MDTLFSWRNHLRIFLPIVLLCIGFAWLTFDNTAPQFVPEAPSKALSLLSTLLLVALFVERSVEVYIGALRSQKAAALDAALSSAKDIVGKLEEKLKAEREKGAGQTPNVETIAEIQAQLADTNKKWHQADAAREEFGAETRRTALMAAVFLGILVATVGPRVLSEMTEPLDELDGIGRALFIGIDIFITGGLIGGGSDGIHKLISVATEKLDKVKAAIRGAPQP